MTFVSVCEKSNGTHPPICGTRSRVGPFSRTETIERGLRHRIVAGLVAAIVSLAAFAFLVTMFRSESDHGAVGTSLSPLTIRVRTTNDPSARSSSRRHAKGKRSSSSGSETQVPTWSIRTPPPWNCPSVRPSSLRRPKASAVAVFGLRPCPRQVRRGGRLVPNPRVAASLVRPRRPRVLRLAPKGWARSGGQAFRAETVSARTTSIPARLLDPNSTVDATHARASATREGPSPAASEVEATRMPGIDAYKVCRVLSLPGDFGDAGDEVVVFEEERVPTAGCVGSEGFQHVAVLRDGRVTALSRRITDVFDEDAWRVWPYATPDLNGDRVDEIAIALRHEPGNATRVWFFVLSPDGSGLEGIYESQGSGPGLLLPHRDGNRSTPLSAPARHLRRAL